MKNINEEILEKLSKLGADEIGFADLECIEANARNGYKYGISIVVKMSSEAIKSIINGVTTQYYHEYLNVNEKINFLCQECLKILISNGFNGEIQAVTKYTTNGSYMTTLPHKTVATLSGLGWIGKNALLVTEKYGCALRLGTVLTDAPLNTGDPIRVSKCGSCDLCKNKCIAQAIKGVNWQVSINREQLINPIKCREIAREHAKKIGLDGAFCGRCIVECAYTQKYLK